MVVKNLQALPISLSESKLATMVHKPNVISSPPCNSNSYLSLHLLQSFHSSYTTNLALYHTRYILDLQLYIKYCCVWNSLIPAIHLSNTLTYKNLYSNIVSSNVNLLHPIYIRYPLPRIALLICRPFF